MLLAAACGGPSRHAILVKDARAAEARNAWLDAAKLYAEACALKPKDAATCRRAQEMRDYGIEIRTYRARELCAARQLGPCVNEFLPLLRVQSNKQHLVQDIVEQAGELAVLQCQTPGPALPSTLGELACLQHWQEPLWRGEEFRVHFAARSRGVAGQLAVMADSQNVSNVGARMSLLAGANCIARLNSTQRSVYQAAARSFTRLLATTLHLKYTSNGTTRDAPGTCAQVSEELGRGLTCDPSPQGSASPPLSVHAEVFGVQPRWQKSHRDTENVATYKSGTEQVTNPDYDRVRLEYELAETRQSDAERAMREQERLCSQTESQADCDLVNNLRGVFDERRRERDSARSSFNREPPTITRDVFRDHHYVTRQHEWISPFRASLKLGDRDWSPEVAEIVFRDTEQKGFAPAGIQADPFQPPSQSYFRDQSSNWLTARITAGVAAEMARRGQAEIDGCTGEKIECWARARYWMGATEYGLPLLQALSKPQPNAEMAAQHELRCTASLL